MQRFPHYFLILCLLFLYACDKTTENEEKQMVEDSLLLEASPDTLVIENTVINPSLVGKWQLSEMKSGSVPITDFGQSTLEFRTNGDLIAESDQVPAETFAFSEDGTYIESDLWDSPIRIQALSGTQLILTEEVDGEKIQYKYIRK
ncbi:MAG: hypothetical protein SF052_06255 [Bacteroidia bacterium]|nr:hypothetical protein [Bacteroidia bacterium]